MTIGYKSDTEECPPDWGVSPRPGDSFCPPNSGSPEYPPKGTFTSGNLDPFFRVSVGEDNGNSGFVALKIPTGLTVKIGTPVRQYYEFPDQDESKCLPGTVLGSTCMSGEGTFQGGELKGTYKIELKSKQDYDVVIVKVTAGIFELDEHVARVEIGIDEDDCRCRGECDSSTVCINNQGTKPAIRKEAITFGGGMKRIKAEACLEGYRCKQGRDYICLPGTFAFNTSNSVCQSCPPGKYSDTTGKSFCIRCPQGWYQNAPQQTKCLQCATGQYAQEDTTPLCSKCPAGYFAPDTNLTKCTACQLGQYQVSEASRDCNHCEAGKDSNASVALADACFDCPSGWHRPAAPNGIDPECAKRLYESSGADCNTDDDPECGANIQLFTDALPIQCQVGYPLCMMCQSHSFGCGNYVQLEEGFNKHFTDVVKYVVDQEKTECPAPANDLKACSGAVGFIMDGFDQSDKVVTKIYFPMTVASKAEETLENRSKFYSSVECVREPGDEAKGGSCTPCRDGWVARGDHAACQDADKVGDLIAKMIPATEWEIESFFDGKYDEDGIGQAHSMKVKLKIPGSMDHLGLGMVHYQLEISKAQDMSVLILGKNDEPLSPRVDIVAGQFDYEFQFQLPNKTASLYEQSYFIRAFPVILVNGNKKVVNVESKLDPDGRVLTDIVPKKKWSTIKDCGGSDQIYLETRTEENALPGENIDDPVFENWRCENCPRGGTCRGESESHWRTLVASFGYWRARHANVSIMAMDNRLYVGRVAFYKCPRPWACLGRKNEEFKGRGWGRKNASYMNTRTPCCDWTTAGTCGEAYDYTNKLGEPANDIAECEKDMYFKEGCSEVCYEGMIEKTKFLSDETYEEMGEICEKNELCEAPDPAGLDHQEQCTNGYVGLTCGNCYNPASDKDDPCFTDPTHVQPGVGVGGRNEMLSCERRKFFMKKSGCEQCPPPRFEVDLGVLFAMVFGIGLGVYLIYKYILKRLFKFMMKYKVLFNDVKRTAGMILDFLQVLNSISAVITIEFPTMLEGFLDIFAGLISFDIKAIMGMPCVDVGGDGINKYGQEVAMPFVFVAIILLFFVFNALRAKSLCPKFCGGRIKVIEKDTGPKVNKLKRKSLAVIRDMQKGQFNAHARHSKKSVSGAGLSALSDTFGNGIFSKEDPPAVQKGVMDMWYTTVNIVWTVLSFYHVPIISKSFNMFRCELIEEVWYLNMDYNIPCYEERHYMGLLAAMIVIIFYVCGMPGFWAHMLYRNRKKLHTPGMVKQAGYTYVMFHTHAQWYWGTLVAMGRKIILAGGLIVLYRQKVMQITIGIIYCSALVVLLQHVRPHRMTAAHWLTTISWMAIALIYSVPLTKEAIKSSPTPGESNSAILVDYYCMAIVQGTMILMFGGMFVSMKVTWNKFKKIQGVANFDPNDYAWLYLEEKDLKAKAAREHAETAKKSHEKRKSIFGFGGSKKEGSEGKKTGKASTRKKGGFRSQRRSTDVMVAPLSDGGGVQNDDDPFGLAGLGMNRPNITANQKLPDHLVRRIQDRRGRRDSMSKTDVQKREQGQKIMRRRSFDASSMIGFDPNQSGKKKAGRSGSTLQRRPSAKMLAMSNDFAQSTTAGDLMIVQPRRQLLGRSKFAKLDPHADDRKTSKEDKSKARAEAKKMLADKKFKVFLNAAEKKGYFGDLEEESELYQAKYAKLVQKYHEKYDAHQAEQSSSDDTSSDEEDHQAPRAIMLKTDLPVVNAFGKKGADLKSALLSSGLSPKFESDTMQEI
jgi:hypothetical protein